MIAGLVGSSLLLFGFLLVFCVRQWRAAGPRERAYTKTMYLLFPLAGIGFGLLLWLIEQILPVRSVSPGVLMVSLSPIFLWMPAILLSRRLTQIRKEEETPNNP
jgi:hypothetical protein